MLDKVIDASAIAAIAFAEPAADAVIDQIDGCRLHAPTLLPFELMNVAWKYGRKQPRARALFLQALDYLIDLSLLYRGVDQRGVVELGLETGLTSYDASYLWLARALRMPLVTLDRKLAAHAKHL
jgi:Predicted nucleic acid-binding protein, contains PIN domain